MDDFLDIKFRQISTARAHVNMIHIHVPVAMFAGSVALPNGTQNLIVSYREPCKENFTYCSSLVYTTPYIAQSFKYFELGRGGGGVFK